MRYSEFGTSKLPAQQQLEAWQAWYGRVFDTSTLHAGDDGFTAHARAWNLDGFALNHVTAPGLSVLRTKTLLRREPVDHWAITLGRRSVTWLDTGSTTLTAPAGVPFVVSLGQTMKNEREADDRIQLYLSRDSFHGIAPLLDACCARPLQPAGGALLADYMRVLLRNLPTLDETDALRLTDATRAMIAACLAPSAQRLGEARPLINVTLMEKVRRAIRRHLRSSALGPELICREAATSRSQLYRLLEGEGGVGHYIQKQRLSEAFSMLCDLPATTTIAAIAEMLCFADSSSFARAFRREFGVSPSDVRDAARAGLPPIPAGAGAHEAERGSFVACLRGAPSLAGAALDHRA
ncbi:helix-turn-helix domain-containing protein [Reyranella sp.]|uniref:helix-turn-helix domain-containing protein n=1 Tax=Reyranella sp. TaxID=1929291 RepID=UPI003BAD056F